jgi:hypothetical protein
MDKPFVGEGGLSLKFDTTRLEQEVSQFVESDWIPDSAGSKEKTIILVSVGGTFNHDFAISGPVKPTPWLERCPYLKQVLESMGCPISRSRLLRLPGGSQTASPVNYNYHWYRRQPVYIPVVTDPDVKFYIDNKGVHIPAGGAWNCCNSQHFRLVNDSARDSIHLVVETKGPLEKTREQAREIPLEPYTFEVLTPREIDSLTAEILSQNGNSRIPREDFHEIAGKIEQFRRRWEETFTRFGHHNSGELSYQDLILDFKEGIAAKAKKWLHPEGKNAVQVISTMLLTVDIPPTKLVGRLLMAKKREESMKHEVMGQDFRCPEFDRPVFIVSAPRAGSTLLFETLSRFPDLWTIGLESHETIEGIPELHPKAHNFSSNRLTGADALPHIASTLRERFTRQLRDRDGCVYTELPESKRPAKVRFLEKTPKNALRIPFLEAVFPGALFIYLYRDPEENISSLTEGWRSRRFIAYQSLPGWPYREWSFLLTPGWSSMKYKPLVEIAAHQWQTANSYIIEDLQTLPRSSWCLVRYSDLVSETGKTIMAISEFSQLNWDENTRQAISCPLPVSRLTISAPAPGKWRKNEKEIARVLPGLKSIINMIEQMTINSKNKKFCGAQGHGSRVSKEPLPPEAPL